MNIPRRLAPMSSVLFVAIACVGFAALCGAETKATKRSSFPGTGVDVFESVFDAEIKITAGPHAGEHLKLENLIDPAQSVARTQPFLGGKSKDAEITFKLPKGSPLPATIRVSDFPMIPDSFKDTAEQETIYLQTLLSKIGSMEKLAIDPSVRPRVS